MGREGGPPPPLPSPPSRGFKAKTDRHVDSLTNSAQRAELVKITQPHGLKKNHATFRAKKNITQPLGPKKNHATSC